MVTGNANTAPSVEQAPDSGLPLEPLATEEPTSDAEQAQPTCAGANPTNRNGLDIDALHVRVDALVAAVEQVNQLATHRERTRKTCVSIP